MSTDYVAEAKRILSEANFPLEQIEIRQANMPDDSDNRMMDSDGGSVDRRQVLAAALEIMADGQPRMAKDIARLLIERGVAGVTRRDVNSVLSREGRGKFVYDSTNYLYKLK